jgi:hypothetical protein
LLSLPLSSLSLSIRPSLSLLSYEMEVLIVVIVSEAETVDRPETAIDVLVSLVSGVIGEIERKVEAKVHTRYISEPLREESLICD